MILPNGTKFKIKSNHSDSTWYSAGREYEVLNYLPEEKSYNVVGVNIRAWVGEEHIDFDSVNIPVLNVNSQGGVKADAGKPRWSLLPWLQVRHVVQVLTFGSLKYSDNNWQKVEPYRYKDAIGRHWQAYMAGEKTDEESGYPHLAHLVCCALFLLWFDDNV